MDKLRCNGKVFYSRTMKKDIQQKLEWIGNIKPNQASFISKELLEDCSKVDKDQIDVLERLIRLTVSLSDDIIIDLGVKKPAYGEFLDVIYLYFFFSHSFLF